MFPWTEEEEEGEKPCFVLERLSQGCAFPGVAIPPALLHVSVWKIGNDGDVDALRFSSDWTCLCIRFDCFHIRLVVRHNGD